MSLFNSHRTNPRINHGSVAEAVQMIETYFKHRDLKVHDHVIADAPTGWWLTEGSAKIFIFVQETPDGAVLRITSPLVFTPQKNIEQFYKRCLDINSNLNSCALATHGDIVLVVSQRPTHGLVQEELDELVWNAAYVADLLDDKLAEEFGCQKYSENANQQYPKNSTSQNH